MTTRRTSFSKLRENGIDLSPLIRGDGGKYTLCWLSKNGKNGRPVAHRHPRIEAALQQAVAIIDAWAWPGSYAEEVCSGWSRVDLAERIAEAILEKEGFDVEALCERLAEAQPGEVADLLGTWGVSWGRVEASVPEVVSEECSACDGNGWVTTVEDTANEAVQGIRECSECGRVFQRG